MASRAKSSTEAISRRQQRVVAIGPIGREEAFGFEGERFWVRNGVVSMPLSGEGHMNEGVKISAALTMRLRSRLNLCWWLQRRDAVPLS